MGLRPAPAVMSLRPQTDLAIPDQTARVTRAGFPKGRAYHNQWNGIVR